MQVIIGSDHAGFLLKEAVKGWLIDWGVELEDVGTMSEEPCDYPDFAARVAESICRGMASRGILVCGSGAGMVITANRFPRVRAMVCFTEEAARLSRLHNDTNCLVLASRCTDHETAEKILRVWWTTPFAGGRHERRLKKLEQIEEKICRGRL